MMPMAKKILVPVFPSEWFYDAVIRAADVVGNEGGLITFAFCRVRPPMGVYANDGDGRPGEIDISTNAGDFDGKDLEQWRELQIAGLEEARQLLYQRGVSDAHIDYLFADEADHEGGAQAIADEAAAGAYDMVILSHGYFDDHVIEEDSTPEEVAEAVQELGEVSLVVC
jgi:nucleotide-binding universal stress UspA family protein